MIMCPIIVRRLTRATILKGKKEKILSEFIVWTFRNDYNDGTRLLVVLLSFSDPWFLSEFSHPLFERDNAIAVDSFHHASVNEIEAAACLGELHPP